MPFRLSFANDGQHLDLFYGLRPQRKPSQVAVIQVGTVMPSQHVARGVDDDLAAIDFDALGMRWVMSEDDIGTGIDEGVGECAILRADLSRARSGPMDGNQDIVDLRPQLADILLHQERIHRNDTGPSVRRECGFADIVELRVAKEPKLDAIALDDDRLARIGKICSAADMGNPGQ